jgi:hypothetical protein
VEITGQRDTRVAYITCGIDGNDVIHIVALGINEALHFLKA